MTVVVADTSPLNYLLLIGEIAILQGLYGEILIPPEVLAELSDVDAPPEVLKWIQVRPAWLQVRQRRRPSFAAPRSGRASRHSPGTTGR